MLSMTRPIWRTALIVLGLFVLGLALWGCAPGEPQHFSGDLAYRHVKAQMSIGPRIPDTEGSQKVRDYIGAELKRQGWTVEIQETTFKGVPLSNILARRGTGPIVLFGAHYDTRRYADQDPDPARHKDPVPGANDGASGVAVLLELARVLGQANLGDVQVELAFFDGEDQGEIEQWPWSVGATYMAQSLSPTEIPRYVVIVDMVGDADQQLYWEQFSDAGLKQEIWDLARDLGYSDTFTPTARFPIIDDHLPFLKRGIPAVDIIDFNYPYWHTVADTADKVAPRSLERVGRVLEEMVRRRVGLTEK
jgi:Zn-dependent M28 family amino/carboxypeptidase